jgi:ferritin-like metal-binding protein YciE
MGHDELVEQLEEILGEEEETDELLTSLSEDVNPAAMTEEDEKME